MSLKKQILASLKTKYKSLGLSEKVLDGVADMLAATTTEEENIETAVSGVENLLKGFQSDVDARVTTAVNKAKGESGKPDPAKPEGGNDPAKPEPTSTQDIAKIISDALAPLTKEIADLKSGNLQKTRKQVLEEKLGDVNPTVKAKILKDFERMKIDTDEDFDSFVDESITDAGELSKAMTTETLGTGGRPKVGNIAPTGKTTQATKEELDAVMSNI